jgi:transposase
LNWGVLVSDLGGEEGTGQTSGRMSSRIEVIGRISGRRHWTVEQKLAMLRDAFVLRDN